MSDISFNCPRCQGVLVVDSKGSGKQVNCPECEARITIPSVLAHAGSEIHPEPEKTTLSCPHCSKQLSLAAHYAGKSAFCPFCGGSIQVPWKCDTSNDRAPLRLRRQEPSQANVVGDGKCPSCGSALTHGDVICNQCRLNIEAAETVPFAVAVRGVSVKKIILIAAVSLIVLVTLCGIAGTVFRPKPDSQFKRGLIYYNGQGASQDYPQAFNQFWKAARRGHVAAQRLVGQMYSRGEGVTVDQGKALVWLHKAAEQGDAEAYKQLGLIYLDGLDGFRDASKAFVFLSKAVKMGCGSLDYSLAELNYHGIGTKQDFLKAFNGFSTSAKQGNVKAQRHLSQMYRLGEGVPKDEQAAHMWLVRAADSGDAEAIKERDALALKVAAAKVAKSTPPLPSPIIKQSVTAEGQAGVGTRTKKPMVNVERDAAEENDNLDKGLVLVNEQWVTREQALNMPSAVAPSVKLREAEQQDLVKSVEMAMADQADTIPRRDSESDNDLVDRGVRLGNSGRDQDAVVLFKQAADRGNALGQYNLGASYVDGLGVEQDASQAVYWYSLAAEQGLALAQTKLGLCYYRGFGVEKNKYTAFEWFQKAAHQGHRDGIACRDSLYKELNAPYEENARLRQELRQRGLNPDDLEGNMEILKRRVERAGLRWPGN